MEKSLIPQYLANVLAVARADNVISDSELAAVEEVCTEVGGKKTDLKKAGRLVEADDFAPKPIGRFSDKVRNAEDMIYVALTDGDLRQDEIGNIIPFLEQVVYYSELGIGVFDDFRAFWLTARPGFDFLISFLSLRYQTEVL